MINVRMTVSEPRYELGTFEVRSRRSTRFTVTAVRLSSKLRLEMTPAVSTALEVTYMRYGTVQQVVSGCRVGGNWL